jgi:hypothetical protein
MEDESDDAIYLAALEQLQERPQLLSPPAKLTPRLDGVPAVGTPANRSNGKGGFCRASALAEARTPVSPYGSNDGFCRASALAAARTSASPHVSQATVPPEHAPERNSPAAIISKVTCVDDPVAHLDITDDGGEVQTSHSGQLAAALGALKKFFGYNSFRTGQVVAYFELSSRMRVNYLAVVFAHSSPRFLVSAHTHKARTPLTMRACHRKRLSSPL